LAGFEVILYGRFWVIPEDFRDHVIAAPLKPYC